MNIFDEIKRLKPPKLGKYGEYLAQQYWNETNCSVQPRHQRQVDFVVDDKEYDVKATAVPCRRGVKYKGLPPKFSGNHKQSVHILRVAIYADLAVIAEEGQELKRLGPRQLQAAWRDLDGMGRKKGPKAARGTEYDQWLDQQKAQLKQLCAERGLKVRIISRNGIDVQTQFGKWGPNSLVAKDPTKHDATICLWTEGCDIYRVIAYRHRDEDRRAIGFYKYVPPNMEPIETKALPLFDGDGLKGKFGFETIDEFSSRFWAAGA